ncbi:MAG: hypothetical protein ACD_51C00072G0006 [uncultured bacterium]|nr:MAG: hypothetical protein ACD_51C00072G0006 [uncultured bacterium]OGJ47153.1 MAG: hypothetical protein A2244_04415 [Candidatus Peregrinibacteria bacterium RIFOXYA2_FULL_41_18]OGJ49358.1 MAG: hypothetical protein A2344_03790 [Candidatus Peregrinibacteria bacterium RIFOXYB12_FULL_41_12]
MGDTPAEITGEQVQLIEPQPEQQDHWGNIRRIVKDEIPGLKVSGEILQDDGGNRIETECIVTANSASDIEKIAQIAIKEGYGVMAIGTRTSAVNVFEANGRAALYNMKGFIGIQIENGLSNKPTLEQRMSGQETAEGDKTILTDEEGNRFEIITALEGKLEIWKSENDEIPHGIRGWAGLTPKQVDDALKTELGLGFTTGLDLTTANQAQLGGAVCTGSQGPARQSARRNIREMRIINAKGEQRLLGRTEAQKHIGLNGMAGIAAEITLDIIEEPKNEFGIFIPIPGQQRESLTKIYPKIMAALARFTEPKKQGRKIVPAHGSMLIKGIEIATLAELEASNHHMTGAAKGKNDGIVRQMSGSQPNSPTRCETGLMINGVSDLDQETLQTMLYACVNEDDSYLAEGQTQDPFFTTLSQLRTAGNIHVTDTSVEGYGALGANEKIDGIGIFRTIRESIPETARASKTRGFTTSTDINCRVTARKKPEKEKAYQAIWETYWRYIEDMRNAGFRVYVYGHTLSGNIDPEEQSGGVDPHIRATYEYKPTGNEADPEKQEKAIEKYLYMEKRKAQLYKELTALNGEMGIIIEAGEKGIVTSQDHVRFLEDGNPEETEALWHTLDEHGGRLMGARAKIKLHSHPPRLKDGLLKYFTPNPDTEADKPLLERLNKSILLWCQNSHRGPEGNKVLSETLRLIREWLGLAPQERVFYAESAEAAVNVAVRNLVDIKGKKKWLDLRNQTVDQSTQLRDVTAVIVSDPALLDNPRLRNKKKILFLDSTDPVDETTRKKADVVIYSAEKFGAGADMGIIITNTDTVKHSAEIEKSGNNTGYAHSFTAMNEHPHETIETPKMQVIAEVGCLLSEKMGYEPMEGRVESARERIATQAKRRSLNPGPSQINPAITDSEPTLEIPIADIEEKLRTFLGVPTDYQIFFGGSATKAMEQIAESLDLDGAVCVSKGSFGDRQASVVNKFQRPNRGRRGPLLSKKIEIPWSKGENSRMDATIANIHGQIPSYALAKREIKNPREAVFTTGHETSTGVTLDTNALHQQLDKRFLRVVDGTSEIGGVRRDFLDAHGDPAIDVYFGSVQKFFGLPSGLSIMIVSPRAMEAARQAEKERTTQENELCYRTFPQMEREKAEGKHHNERGIRQLGMAVDSFMARGGIDTIVAETIEKMHIIDDILGRNKHVAQVVEDARDKSEVMAHITAIDVDIKHLRERLGRIGIDIGEGYGPMKSTTLRMFLTPNISTAEFKQMIEEINRTINQCILPDGAIRPNWLHRDHNKEWEEARSAS